MHFGKQIQDHFLAWFEPKDANIPERTRIRMRLISLFLLVENMIGITFIAILAVVSPALFKPENYAILLLALALNFALFWFSRLNYQRFIIIANSILVTGVIWLIYITTQIEDDRTLFFLILPLFFIGIFLPYKYTILFGIVNITLLLLLQAFPQHQLNIVRLLGELVYQIMIVVLIVLGSLLVEYQLNRVSKAEMRVRNLMEANREIVVIFKADGAILDVNSAFERILTVERKAVIGTTLLNLVHPDDRPLAIHWQDRLTEVYSLRVPIASGTNAIIELAVYPHQTQDGDHYVLVGQDVSSQQKIERDRYQYQMRYRSLFEQTTDAIYVIDLDFVLIDCNDRALELHGCIRDEIIGNPFVKWVVEDERIQSDEVTQRLLAGEKIPLYERAFYRKDGTSFFGEVNVILVRDNDGNPMYFQSAVRDTTERRNNEKRNLRLALQQERMTLLQDFIGNASHYFRTPLANIKTSAYLMSRIHQNPEKFAHQLDITRAEIRRMERLIDNLLMMSRLNKSEDVMTGKGMSDIQARPFIEAIVNNQRQIASHADYRLVVDINISVRLTGHHNQLEDAFTRIIHNAITYCQRPPQVNIHVFSESHLLIVDIMDNGIGILPEDLPNIFNNFYRGKDAHQYDPYTSGLGLSIASRVVELHHGYLTVTSKSGEGTSIRIVLPVMNNPYRNIEEVRQVELPPPRVTYPDATPPSQS